MGGTLIALLLLGVPPAEGGAVPDATAPQAASVCPASASPRTGAELRDAVRAALRRWARPSDEVAEEAALQFLALYDELGKDDKLANSQREYFRCKVRLRLLDLSEQISKRIAREKRSGEKRSGTVPIFAERKWDCPLPEPESQVADRPASVALPQGKAGLLAQQVPVPNIAAGFGQSGVGQRGAGGDYGPQLVELIQRTIAPASWDVNGGPGSIYYWYPGRALVVRQTGEVHDGIGNLLRQLGRANQ